MSRKRSYSGEFARSVVRAKKAARAENSSSPSALPAPPLPAPRSARWPSRTTVYTWMHTDMSKCAIKKRLSRRGRKPKLAEDQEVLLIGYVIQLRLALKAVNRNDVRQFAQAYFGKKLIPQYVSDLMKKYGLSFQTSLPRQSRMIEENVVDDAMKLISELREEGWQPMNIIVMDETGIWSNSISNKTYHFKNWYELSTLHSNLLFHSLSPLLTPTSLSSSLLLHVALFSSEFNLIYIY